MKAIIYIIAIIAIAVGGWFSLNSMGKFKDLQNARKELDGQNESRKSRINQVAKEAQEAEEKLNAAKRAFAEVEAARENSQNTLKSAKRDVDEWDNKVAEQKEQLAKVQEVMTGIKDTLAREVGNDVQINEIPTIIQKVKSDLAVATKDIEELDENISAAKNRVQASEGQIADLTERMVKRTTRIRANAVAGRVTGVDDKWGFVTVNIPRNMPVTNASKLLIKRGSTYIADIKISSIEGHHVVGNIDYDTLQSGMIVQAGDHVVLSKPVTN